MKKLYSIIIFLFLLLMPFNISAYEEGISKYYIDMTVKENGNLHIKELIVLNGEFNGFERIINYENNKLINFDGSLNSFRGSDIYNGTGINLISIKNIEVDKNSKFDTLYNDGELFTEVLYASKGDYGKYVRSNTNVGERYLIYNPSRGKERGFYIEYELENVGVVHNDVGEVAINIFDSLTEYINVLEIKIHIPNNKELLRGWAHGPLTGEITLVNNNLIEVKVTKIDANNPIDVRFAFDKDVIKDSIKFSNVKALDKIVEVETEWADEANALREQIRLQLEKEKLIEKIYIGVFIAWIIGLVLLIRHVYKKYDKEYSAEFKGHYYRDIPANYGPEVLGYLLNKKLTPDDLSASIMNLINKKIILVEKVLGKRKEDYLLKKNGSDVNVAEKNVLELVFGSKEEILLSEFKKEAKKSYETFLSQYDDWKLQATAISQAEEFYEENDNKNISLLYSLLGFILTFVLYRQYINFIIYVVMFLLSLGSAIYFLSITKRTKKGNEDYSKWMGLKRFLKDFSTMDTKSLPEVILWEKYLVYAMPLGCAKKLSKDMQLKIKEMEVYDPSVIDMYDIGYMLHLNRVINSTMISSVQTAHNELTREKMSDISSSSSSSGRGFGGGFSSGGGFFGGGGGGGRF